MTTVPIRPAADASAAPSDTGSATTATPKSASRSGNPRRGPPRAAAADPLSDKATILLIRRTLCPEETQADGPTGSATTPASVTATTTNTTSTTSTTPPPSAASPTPIHEMLPPLTSRNDVDVQLYGLLAVVVREFVQPWYAKISPDAQFVTEIVHIAAHCTRGLEQRLRRLGPDALGALLLDELPAVLDSHVQSYRAAAQTSPPLQLRRRAAYHALCPLPALEPVPEDGDDDKASTEESAEAASESAYRQLLVQGVLAVLLPTEDLENGCLTSLVGQIFAELLIGSVLARRLAEPWMMWEVVGMVSRLIREKIRGEEAARPKHKSFSSSSSSSSSPPPSSSWLGTAAPFLWTLLRFGFAVFAGLRFFVLSIALARSLPPRQSPPEDPDKSPHITTTSTATTTTAPVPILAFGLWRALSTLVELDARMPWLGGGLSLLQWLAITGPGRIGAVDGPFDRLLAHYVRRYVVDPVLLPVLLRALRSAVFPGNKFGAPPTLVPPASPAEAAARRRRTAGDVWVLLHPTAADSSQATDAALADIEGALAVFDDAYCNRHLLYGVLEAVLVRLMPELAETGVQGLWEGRLS